MRILSLGLVASGSLFLYLALLGCAAVIADAPQPPGNPPSSLTAFLSLSVTDGKLNLNSGGAPLSQVLEAITAHSGIPIYMQSQPKEQITLSVTNLALDEGLQRILRGKNFVLLYAASPATSGGQRSAQKLKAVHVFADGAPQVLLTAHSAPEADQVFDYASPWDEQNAADGLAKLLLEGKSKRSRKRAAKALGDVWSAEVVGPLGLAVLEDNEPLVRKTAATSLGQTWSEEAVEPLQLALLEDQDPAVRAAAALALGETWSDEAVESLSRAFLEDPDPVVREYAARALREIGGEEALNSLKEQ
jgi:hypothetical protein